MREAANPEKIVLTAVFPSDQRSDQRKIIFIVNYYRIPLQFLTSGGETKTAKTRNAGVIFCLLDWSQLLLEVCF